MSNTTNQFRSRYQKLFEYLHTELGAIPLDSDLHQIEDIVLAMQKPDFEFEGVADADKYSSSLHTDMMYVEIQENTEFNFQAGEKYRVTIKKV